MPTFTSVRHYPLVQVFLYSYWACRSIRKSVTRSNHPQSEVAVAQFTYRASGAAAAAAATSAPAAAASDSQRESRV